MKQILKYFEFFQIMQNIQSHIITSKYHTQPLHICISHNLHMGRLWLAEIVTPSACAITPGSSSGIAHSVVWKYY